MTDRHAIIPLVEEHEWAGWLFVGMPYCLACGRPLRLSDARRGGTSWWHANVARRPHAWRRARCGVCGIVRESRIHMADTMAYDHPYRPAAEPPVER